MRVRLVESASGGAREGVYVGTDLPALGVYGVWTIRLDDGTLFRTEGRLTEVS